MRGKLFTVTPPTQQKIDQVIKGLGLLQRLNHNIYI